MTDAVGTTRRGILAFAAVAVATLGMGYGAHAQQAYPSQPIRFVIAFGPGGVGDTTSRLVAEKVPAALVMLPGGTDFRGGQGYVQRMEELVKRLEQGLQGKSPW